MRSSRVLLIALALASGACATSAHAARPASAHGPESSAAETAHRREAASTCEADALRAQAVEQRTRVTELESRLALAETEARDLRATLAEIERASRQRDPSIRISASLREEGIRTHEPERSPRDESSLDDLLASATDDNGGARPMLTLYGEPSRPVTLASPPPSEARPPLPAPAFSVPTPPTGVHDRLPVAALPGVPLNAPPAWLAPAPNPAPQEDAAVQSYRAALNLLQSRRFGEALIALDAFVQRNPTHAYVASALYWKGEVHYAMRHYEEAVSALREMIQLHPRATRVPDALLKIGLCHRRMGDMATARSYFRRVLSEFPQSDAARLASREDAS